MTDKKKILAKLFFSTLYLSAFTFGGGYVIVTLMKQKFVDELHWIQEDEMLDLIAIAQSAPGAIAVNGAIVVGFKLAGVLGAVTAIVATIIPPFLVITVISYFYELFRDNYIVSSVLSGMQAGVGAVIASVVLDMGGGVLKQKSVLSIVVMLTAFVATYVYKINAVYIILACIPAANMTRQICRTLLSRKRKSSRRNRNSRHSKSNKPSRSSRQPKTGKRWKRSSPSAMRPLRLLRSRTRQNTKRQKRQTCEKPGLSKSNSRKTNSRRPSCPGCRTKWPRQWPSAIPIFSWMNSVGPFCIIPLNGPTSSGNMSAAARS